MFRYLNLSNELRFGMKDFFDVALINQSCLKADESYVEYDEAGFADIDVLRVVDIFELQNSHGKHDGDKVVQTILDMYDSSSVLTLTK